MNVKESKLNKNNKDMSEQDELDDILSASKPELDAMLRQIGWEEPDKVVAHVQSLHGAALDHLQRQAELDAARLLSDQLPFVLDSTTQKPLRQGKVDLTDYQETVHTPYLEPPLLVNRSSTLIGALMVGVPSLFVVGVLGSVLAWMVMFPTDGAPCPDNSGIATIILERVPQLGSHEDLSGRVCLGPDDESGKYGIVTYIRVHGKWWNKPFFDKSIVEIEDDLFVVDITTGGIDEEADSVRIFLVPKGHKVPRVEGNSELPAEIAEKALASVEVKRRPPK